MKTKHFTELEVWKKSLELATKIFEYTPTLEDEFFRNELSVAALDIMRRIAIASSSEGIDEQVRNFQYSVSACIAVENLTYLMQELELMDEETASELRKLSTEIKESLSSFTEVIEEGFIED